MSKSKVTGPSRGGRPSRPSYNPELPGPSGICVGCCLGEDASLTAAPLAQSLSSRPGERRPARGRHRHAMVVGALVPPDAARGATVYTSAPKRLREAVFADLCTLLRVPTVARTILASRNSVHKCPKTAPRDPILPFVYTIAIPRPPTTQAHSATVYTNAPKRHRGASFADLCTLLRRCLGDEAHHAARAVTQPPTRTHEAPVPGTSLAHNWQPDGVPTWPRAHLQRGPLPRVRLSVRPGPKPTPAGPGATPPRSLAGGCSSAFAQLSHFP